MIRKQLTTEATSHGVASCIQGDGMATHLVTCDCGWERASVTPRHAERIKAEHAKKCDGVPPVKASPGERSPKPRASWDDREESTWIDSL